MGSPSGTVGADTPHEITSSASRLVAAAMDLAAGCTCAGPPQIHVLRGFGRRSRLRAREIRAQLRQRGDVAICDEAIPLATLDFRPVQHHVCAFIAASTPSGEAERIATLNVSTTSSFAVRPRQLLENVVLLRLMPYSGGAFDHTTSLTLQRRYPFTRPELLGDLLPFGEPARDWPRSLTRGLVRATLGLRALRRPSRRRSLYEPTHDLITRLEIGAFDPSEDWGTLARRSSEWATKRVAGAGARPGTVAGQPRP